MTSPTPKHQHQHPLLDEPERLNRILDVMYAKIHKTLSKRNPGLKRKEHGQISLEGAGKKEAVLTTRGTSADDILAESYLALMTYPEEKLTTSWEALSVVIAHKKTVGEIRKATKSRGGTQHRPELYVVSGDQKGPDGEGGISTPSIFEVQPDEWAGLEAEYFAIADVLEVRDLARELLSDVEQDVFFRIHFQGYKRWEIGESHGKTPQWASGIYLAAVGKLEADPRYPYGVGPNNTRGESI